VNDNDLDLIDAEATQMRRHFRRMTLWRAWCTAWRVWWGWAAFDAARALLNPHISQTSRVALETAEMFIMNDADAMAEGFQDAIEISDKAWAQRRKRFGL